ncbi:MAG: UDP-N-acetylmuramate--alanine ligase [Sphingomonadales bacterium]|nr:UDP-N-acetylmuramate--alanine ligase [Sphingomonadales bacterium]MBD3773447.1 UDP-N-acetylmuramate--alanine ligase [Paracoccaceae bacterium]
MVDSSPPDLTAHPWFFCGIGGSGMFPLAQILKGRGARVAGSDRSRDQGRSPEKFAWLEAQGFTLFPQDGSGITSADQILVASAAVEDSVPEVARAAQLGCRRMSRAELLADLFNSARFGIAVGGTSGKSTVTGMLGWILADNEYDPTIMNGAVMKNFRSADVPFASAVVGTGAPFVSEVDESDGSIALYRPKVGVLLNVSLDHKSIEELRALFRNFLKASARVAVNFDDEESFYLAEGLDNVLPFGIHAPQAVITIEHGTIEETPTSIAAVIIDKREKTAWPLTLPMPGRHNLSNALAAIAGANAAGVPVEEAVHALRLFAGMARRFDIVGTSASGVTVIDDFGHNPEKCAATLRALRAHPGRVIAFFQPHGYGPLRQMGHELAATFARELADGDRLVLCDPVYFGGTVDRSEGSERIVAMVREMAGAKALEAEYIASREECGQHIARLAQPGDRIVVMGARDDTLTGFAQGILAALA